MELLTASRLVVQFCEDAILSGSHQNYETVSQMAIALHVITGNHYEVVTGNDTGEWYGLRKRVQS